MNPLPRWLRPYLKESDLTAIRHLVGQIEQKTDAELVPIIVRSSVDIKLLRGLFLAMSFILTLVVGPIIHSFMAWETGISLDLLYLFSALVFIPMAWLCSTNTHVIRSLYSKNYLDTLVFRRACGEFFENRLDHIESRTAVLFMYSVVERKAMIVADPNLRSFPSQVWKTAVGKMIEAAKEKNFSDGFQQALNHCATELNKQFPPKDVNKNEFEDHVLIKD